MDEEMDKTVDQLNEEADIAADYLEGLLDIADYGGDIEMGVRNNRPVVQIVADDGEDLSDLIGRNGEVVDALQQLTRLAVQQKTGERSHLILDVDGFLKRKRQRLQKLALDAVEQARETGDVVRLRAMNSFERKIVHDIVREQGLKSRSHGEEPHRYVTIYAKITDTDEQGGEDASKAANAEARDIVQEANLREASAEYGERSLKAVHGMAHVAAAMSDIVREARGHDAHGEQGNVASHGASQTGSHDAAHAVSRNVAVDAGADAAQANSAETDAGADADE